MKYDGLFKDGKYDGEGKFDNNFIDVEWISIYSKIIKIKHSIIKSKKINLFFYLFSDKK